MNFCAATLILKIEENMQHLQYIWFIISRQVKVQIECKIKKICAVYEEGAVTDQKWYVKFLLLFTFWPNNSYCRALVCTGRCLSAPVASTHEKPIGGDS